MFIVWLPKCSLTETLQFNNANLHVGLLVGRRRLPLTAQYYYLFKLPPKMKCAKV